MKISKAAGKDAGKESSGATQFDTSAMFKLSYGLYLLTAKLGDKDNGCIINAATQITVSPLKMSIVVNKSNLTHDMILKTGEFALSVLTESVPFSIFEQFGFHSGKDIDKFAGCSYEERTVSGIRYLPEHTNCIISAKVTEFNDYMTHTLFIADVTQIFSLSDKPSATYQYYFDHIRTRANDAPERRARFICKICGYMYEAEKMPAAFMCPLCRHGADEFKKV